MAIASSSTVGRRPNAGDIAIQITPPTTKTKAPMATTPNACTAQLARLLVGGTAMATSLVRTMPASGMAKPAASHTTTKPPLKNSTVLRLDLTAGLDVAVVPASCARADVISSAIAGSTVADIDRAMRYGLKPPVRWLRVPHFLILISQPLAAVKVRCRRSRRCGCAPFARSVRRKSCRRRSGRFWPRWRWLRPPGRLALTARRFRF